MEKDNKTFAQEFHGSVKPEGSTHQKNVAEVNDIQQDSTFIIGGGDPNLSADAGKPMI